MNQPAPSAPSGDEVILYQTEDGRTRLQVRLQGETVWLTQAQLAELFQRDILPRLGMVKLSEIVEAAGLSKSYASDIRRGKWTPTCQHGTNWGSWSAHPSSRLCSRR